MFFEFFLQVIAIKRRAIDWIKRKILKHKNTAFYFKKYSTNLFYLRHQKIFFTVYCDTYYQYQQFFFPFFYTEHNKSYILLSIRSVIVLCSVWRDCRLLCLLTSVPHWPAGYFWSSWFGRWIQKHFVVWLPDPHGSYITMSTITSPEPRLCVTLLISHLQSRQHLMQEQNFFFFLHKKHNCK